MSGHTEDEQAPIILPAADYITWNYSWDIGLGPVVADNDGNRFHLSRATLTEHVDGTLDAVSAEGYRINNDGSYDQRYSRHHVIHGSRVAGRIKAAHKASQNARPVDTEAKLIEAYHAVFDVKDTQTPGWSEGRGDPNYLAFEACRKIQELMQALGFKAPRRSDDLRPLTPTVSAIDTCEHINQKFHGDVASCTDCGACPV